eukprot:5273576-Amphidinium_carterae.1
MDFMLEGLREPRRVPTDHTLSAVLRPQTRYMGRGGAHMNRIMSEKFPRLGTRQSQFGSAALYGFSLSQYPPQETAAKENDTTVTQR